MKTSPATSSTDPPAAETAPTQPKILLAKIAQHHPKQPKLEPPSAPSTQPQETLTEEPVYISDTDSEELDVKATMEDEELDRFQDEMAVAYNTNNPDDDTDFSMPAPSQPIEPSVFMTKPPTMKRP